VRLLRLDADVVLVPAATLVPADQAGESPNESRPGPAAISSDDRRCLWDARRLLLESEDVLDGVSLDPSLPTARRA